MCAAALQFLLEWQTNYSCKMKTWTFNFMHDPSARGKSLLFDWSWTEVQMKEYKVVVSSMWCNPARLGHLCSCLCHTRLILRSPPPCHFLWPPPLGRPEAGGLERSVPVSVPDTRPGAGGGSYDDGGGYDDSVDGEKCLDRSSRLVFNLRPVWHLPTTYQSGETEGEREKKRKSIRDERWIAWQLDRYIV